MKRDDPRLIHLHYLRSLRERSVRDRDQVFLVEGVRAVVSAFDHGADVLSLIVCPRLLRSPIGQIVARRRRQAGWPTLRLDSDRFTELALMRAPQGIAAVVRQRWDPLPARGDRALWLAVQRVASPGNLGSMMRTACASGATGVAFVGPDADPFHPSVVRATMGAHFQTRFARVQPDDLCDWKRRTRCRVVGISPDACDDFRASRYRGRTLLMIGGERRGLSPEQRGLCDQIVRIPMEPGVDSLNTAVAASLVLYEAYRQRGTGEQP